MLVAAGNEGGFRAAAISWRCRMALKRRMIAGIDDIEAVTFLCSTCKARTTIPAASLIDVPQQCTACNSEWWRANEFTSNESTSGPAGMALVQAIRTLMAMIQEGEDRFRILLEFES
jgi:hypothetical protein